MKVSARNKIGRKGAIEGSKGLTERERLVRQVQDTLGNVIDSAGETFEAVEAGDYQLMNEEGDSLHVEKAAGEISMQVEGESEESGMDVTRTLIVEEDDIRNTYGIHSVLDKKKSGASEASEEDERIELEYEREQGNRRFTYTKEKGGVVEIWYEYLVRLGKIRDLQSEDSQHKDATQAQLKAIIKQLRNVKGNISEVGQYAGKFDTTQLRQGQLAEVTAGTM